MTAITQVPDAHGHFGPYGGMFVPETLISALDALTAEYAVAKNDPAFQSELDELLRNIREVVEGWLLASHDAATDPGLGLMTPAQAEEMRDGPWELLTL